MKSGKLIRMSLCVFHVLILCVYCIMRIVCVFVCVCVCVLVCVCVCVCVCVYAFLHLRSTDEGQ